MQCCCTCKLCARLFNVCTVLQCLTSSCRLHLGHKRSQAFCEGSPFRSRMAEPFKGSLPSPNIPSFHAYFYGCRPTCHASSMLPALGATSACLHRAPVVSLLHSTHRLQRNATSICCHCRQAVAGQCRQGQELTPLHVWVCTLLLLIFQSELLPAHSELHHMHMLTDVLCADRCILSAQARHSVLLTLEPCHLQVSGQAQQSSRDARCKVPHPA